MTTRPITVTSFEITGAPALDPIRVHLQDLGPGIGRVTIECYGNAWSACWGAMGDRTTAAFILMCDVHYLVCNLIASIQHRPNRTTEKRTEGYLTRIVQAIKEGLKSTTTAQPDTLAQGS